MEGLFQYSLSRSTWSTYKTGWTQFNVFLVAQGYQIELPVPREVLCRYIIYAYFHRRLTVGTIRGYIAGIKFIHNMANKSVAVFSDFWVVKLLDACDNLDWASLKEKTPSRCAFTLPVVKVFGHELAVKSKLAAWDKSGIWTAVLLAYHVSLRLGDFLPTGHGIDWARVLSWDRIRVVNKNHLAIVLILPKNTKSHRSQGVVRDVFRFDEQMYCPIYHLTKLYSEVKKQPDFKESQPVFRRLDKKPLTSRQINKLIKQLVTPILGPHFSGHSFRCGVVSLMSANSDMFTPVDAMRQGDWSLHGNSHERYERLHAVGAERTHEKIKAASKRYFNENIL